MEDIIQLKIRNTNSKCLQTNCNFYSKINGYCNKHKLPQLPNSDFDENILLGVNNYSVVYNNIINLKLYKKYYLYKSLNFAKVNEGNIIYYNNLKLELKIKNKYNIFWLKIKCIFIFSCKYIKIKTKIKKEESQNTSFFKNKEYMEYYFSNFYHTKNGKICIYIKKKFIRNVKCNYI